MEEKKKRAWLTQKIRRISYQWPMRTYALRKARVKRGQYKCKKCGRLYKRNEIQLDHKKPVVAVSGFRDWNEFIERMFCDEKGFQVLCKPCHKYKTSKENSKRKKKKVKT